MGLIEKDKLLSLYKSWLPQLPRQEDAGDRHGVEICIAALGDMPTVDAVEVIRCRDCRYWDTIQNKPGKGICAPPSKAHGGYCIRRGATDDTDFCSKGERRENRGKAD